jgi:hypothetical protein
MRTEIESRKALPSNSAVDRDLEFHRLAEQWRNETGVFSTVERKAIHPAYQRIIGMGKDAIPLILTEMSQRPGHWFWALRSITGENPVTQEHAGNVAAMTEDWLDWGKTHHYI